MHSPPPLPTLVRLAGLAPNALYARQRSGQAVVDVRSIHACARGHIPVVYHVELSGVLTFA